MKVSEIFLSIEGEGIRTGYPAVFIRLFGCNIACSYCDSMYSVVGDNYTEMTVDEIIDEVDTKYPGVDKVTITGGEPLVHEHVAELICKLGENHEINIETNGAVSLEPLRKITGRINPGVIVTMDWKSISSGMSSKMIKENLDLLTHQDVLKFVVGTDEDLLQMKNLLLNNRINCSIFVSPIFGQIEPADIVKFILDNKLYYCRVQVQLHKIIYDPNMRGV